MKQKLSSLAFVMLAFLGIGYYLIAYEQADPEMVALIFGPVFALWFVFWFAWAFRWVIVVAPVVICYILFAFWGMDRAVVGTGATISGVLFVLVGSHYWYSTRKEKKAKRKARKQLNTLKRQLGE
ncbi:hypothetical protein [Marinibacterium profundimaris]|uniref:Uncharacterized protein n=1 Tax=Marinibacterium profundimaris TaxID=1679460 RepID=A0A225NA98_9RHOB|nr:hypothetical protein [Marinibacterium profundimaris]OWU66793.1 hypothetical protein ATO3_27410 [Marinibacterium profundimaris]